MSNIENEFFDFKRKARKSLSRPEQDYRDLEAKNEVANIVRKSGGTKTDPEYLKEIAAALYREALTREEK